MAGIKQFLDKRPEFINFVMNELLNPEIRHKFFDDMAGWQDVTMLLLDPLTIVYGVFEKGHPVPIGCVFLTEVKPYRGCVLNAVIFKPENRNAKKMQSVVEMVRGDLISRWNLRFVEARVIEGNAEAVHILEKVGFKKVGSKPDNMVVNGKYVTVEEFYLMLDDGKGEI